MEPQQADVQPVNNQQQEQQEQQPAHAKIKLVEVNSHLTCYLCKGYYIDATTIVECLHSFCRSCIIKHLTIIHYCPICEVMINTAKPNIKPDKTLQDIVYKLVPGLFASEMARRRIFYADYPKEARDISPEARGLCTERIIFSPQDAISLSIEYTSDDKPDWNRNQAITGYNSELPLRRYLQCPAMLRVEHLKKFICNKYSVDSALYHVDILHKRVPLPDHYTLMDIAYIYSWKRNEPMKFFFRITDINLVSERFDYFEPSSSTQEEETPEPPLLRCTIKLGKPSTIPVSISAADYTPVGDTAPAVTAAVPAAAAATAVIPTFQIQPQSKTSEDNKTICDIDKMKSEDPKNVDKMNKTEPRPLVNGAKTEDIKCMNVETNKPIKIECANNVTVKIDRSPIKIDNPVIKRELPSPTKYTFSDKLNNECVVKIETNVTDYRDKSRSITEPNLNGTTTNLTVVCIETKIPELTSPKKCEDMSPIPKSPVQYPRQNFITATPLLSPTQPMVTSTINVSKLSPMSEPSPRSPSSLRIDESPSSDVDLEKSQFLKSIQLTAKSSPTSPVKSSPPKIVPPKPQLCLSTPVPQKRKYVRKEKPAKKIKLSSDEKAIIEVKDDEGTDNKNIQNSLVRLMMSNVNQQVSNLSKLVSQTDVSKPSELQSLFDNCKINIPSSLSITLTVSPKGEDGSTYESKPAPMKPVQNYIEILKLPEEKQCDIKEDNIDGKPDIKNNNTLNDLNNAKKQQQHQQQLTFQTMFEEAIKKNEYIRSQIFQLNRTPKGPEPPKKVSVLKTKRNLSNALDLTTPPLPKSETKRNLLDIAQHLTKKSKVNEGPHLTALTPAVPLNGTPKHIFINNNYGGGCISIRDKSPVKPPEKVPIPRLPIAKAPTLKLTPPNIKNGNLLRFNPSFAKILPKKPVLSPKTGDKIPEATVQLPNGMTANQLLEKYNITSLAQLNANINQAQLAFQQALLMTHQFEMHRLQQQQNGQKIWLNNPNVLAHYENYVQSLKNQNLCNKN